MKPCYTSRVFRKACARLDIRHRCTRPYTPRINGKAEHFIQTELREWPMQRSIRHPWNVTAGCRSGSTATTGTDLTAVS